MAEEIVLDYTEDTMQGQFLTFALGEEHYGIEIRYVTEIVGMQAINTIPEAPVYIKGIINLRGKVIPVIDMRLKFKKEEIDYTERTCIIVIDTEETSVGLIVDMVDEVVRITDEQIAPPPAARTGVQNRYLMGIGKANDDIKLLLDCEKLFTEEEADDLDALDTE